MDERDYKAMNKELQQETEKNCIGCMYFNYLTDKDRSYCYNDNAANYGKLLGNGRSCELKQIRK
jgi:hypothetical protein